MRKLSIVIVTVILLLIACSVISAEQPPNIDLQRVEWVTDMFDGELAPYYEAELRLEYGRGWVWFGLLGLSVLNLLCMMAFGDRLAGADEGGVGEVMAVTLMLIAFVLIAMMAFLFALHGLPRLIAPEPFAIRAVLDSLAG